MSRFDTNNPIDSADYRDGSDNLKTLDQVVNSSAQTVLNRFGVARPTLAGVEARINGIYSSLLSGVLSEFIESIGPTEGEKQNFAESLDLVRAVNNPVTGGSEFSSGLYAKVFLPASGVGCAAKIQACIDYMSEKGGGTVELDGALYDIQSTEIVLKSGVILKGVKGKTIISSDQIVNLLKVASGSKMAIVDIKFQSLKVDSTENSYGLVYSVNSSITGMDILGCVFTAASANVNGLKIVAESEGVSVDGIDIHNCVFKSIGRMGVEFQNHNDSVVADRYYNISIEKCTFDDVGRVSNGMGVSLSGRGTGCSIVRNRFINCLLIGIELIGAQHSICSQNEFSGYIYRIVQTAGERPMYGITISNNKTIGRVTGQALYLASLVNPYVLGNELQTTLKVEIKSSGTKFSDNKIDTTGVYACIIDNAADCTVTGNTLRNDAGASNWAVLRLYGAGTTRTLVCENRLHRANGGGWIDQISGASGNVVERNYASDSNLFLIT